MVATSSRQPMPEPHLEQPAHGGNEGSAAGQEHPVHRRRLQRRHRQHAIHRGGKLRQLRRDPALEGGARHLLLDVEAGVPEAQHRPFGAGQLRLHGRDGLVELIAQLLLDHPDQPAQPLRLLGGAGDVADLAQGAGRPHQGQAMPAGQAGVVLGRNGHVLAHDPICAALAQVRCHHALGDAGVETVPSHADAGGGQRRHRPGRAGIEAQQREVAGAAAEVADQHGGRGLQDAGEAEAGGLWLVGHVHLAQAGLAEGLAQSNLAERVVREFPGEAHRPAGGDAGSVHVLPGHQAAQEQGHQCLQRERAAHDLGAAEAALRQVGLHGHDQARVLGVVQVGRHRSWPRGVAQHSALGPEAQDCPEHLQPRPLRLQHRAVRVQHGDDAVGRAEIYADAGRADDGELEGHGARVMRIAARRVKLAMRSGQ